MPSFPTAASIIATKVDRVQNSGAAETDLITLRLLPGVLRNVGDTLVLTLASFLAANNNAKTNKVYLGTTQISTRTGTDNNLPRTTQIWITKRAPNSQNVCAMEFLHGAGVNVIFTDTTEAEDVPMLIRYTGQGVSTGDIESRLLQVGYVPVGSTFGF